MNVQQRVIALNSNRLRTWEAAKGLLDDVARSGHDMTAEQRSSWDRMNAEIVDIDAEVRQLVAIEQREREADGLREATLGMFGSTGVFNNEQRAADNLRAWLKGANDPTQARTLSVDLRPVMRERELLRQGASPAEIRALAWDASSGSLVVPTSMARSLFEVLEAEVAAFRMGATRLNTTSGENLVLPKLVTHALGTQVAGQGTAFAGTDPTFSNVPLNTFKYGELVRVASELIDDASFDIGAWLGKDIGYAIAHTVNTALTVGTGSGQPTGYTVLAGAGTNAPVTTGGSLIAPTVEKWIDTVYSVNDNARKNGAWLMKDSTAGTIRKLRDGAGGTVGALLWNPSLTNGLQGGQPDRFLGYPVFTDPNCAAAGSAAKLATFGDPSEYVIRTVGEVKIDRDDSVFFASDEYAYRGKWRVGGNHTQVSHQNQLLQQV